MRKATLLFFIIFCLLSSAYSQGVEGKDGDRLSARLLSLLQSHAPSDSIDVIITAKDNEETHIGKKGRVLYHYGPAHTLIIRATVGDIRTLTNERNLLFIDAVRQPKEELTTGAFDLATNKISLAHHHYPAVDGRTTTVAIKEQLLDTTDIDIKGRYFNSGLAAPLPTSHAAIMATIVAGGGNTSDYALGAAPGALLTSTDFARLLPEPDIFYQQYHISVQNHSYGTGIENYYGADAAAYDLNVWNNPTLVHVMSAGNAGNSTSATGMYAGISNMANLTGSFKMAKNIITVGHTDSFYHLMPLSSKGPAYDGRIKPELVAFGEDGSSGAAALVSGTVALLQQTYKEKTGALPPAHLVKAILLNSADDIGAKGIDFESGYGSLNADAALKTVMDGRYIVSGIADKESKTVSLTIPSGIARAAFTIAWTDTAAAPNATKALVNDIDLAVEKSSTGEIWLPWVLHTIPQNDSLHLPPTRDVDTLNNVEQITIDHPEAGDYLLWIRGRHMVTASQPFAIAYQLDSINQFSWAYPTGSDVLQAGTGQVLRWQTNVSGSATLEYSIQGGPWHTITTSADLSQPYYKWQTPDTTATAVLRLTVPSIHKVIATDTFVVSKPTQLQVGFNCADSVLLYWHKLPHIAYQLLGLGDQYLQPLFTTQDSFVVIKKNQYPTRYFSVVPLAQNKRGLHSFTIDYTTQGVGCYLQNFLVDLQPKGAILTAEIGTWYDVASLTFYKLTNNGYQELKTVTAAGARQVMVSDTALLRGVNRYQVLIQLSNGEKIWSQVERVYHFTDLPVIVYPNPARQQEPIHIIADLPFSYSIQLYDASGKLLRSDALNGFTNHLLPYSLSKGIYFIKILSEEGKLGVQKLVVQ